MYEQLADCFRSHGLAVVAPGPDDRDYVHQKYVSELVRATFLPATRDGIVAVMDRLREQHAVEGVILGGTELPLLLRDVRYPVPFLDTTRIHVEAVLDAALGAHHEENARQR